MEGQRNINLREAQLNRSISEQVLQMLALLACCAGIYLGLHFNILALLPFALLGAGAFIASSPASDQSLLESTGSLILPMVAVQAGYMVGLTGREIYAHLLARLKISQSRRV